MDVRKKVIKNSVPNALKVIFAIVGFAFMIGGLFWFMHQKSIVETGEVIKAVISNIDSYRDSDGDTEHHAYVDYSYGGEEYSKVKMSEYSSNMYEGKEIEVYINPDNPWEVTSKSLVYLGPIIFGGIGAVFFVIAMAFVGFDTKKKNKIQKIIQNGTKVYGIVESGYEDRTYKVNGRSPYKFKCSYEDEYSGQKIICESGRVWEYPDNYIGQQVTIYVDRNNKANYYVDLEELFSRGQVMGDIY